MGLFNRRRRKVDADKVEQSVDYDNYKEDKKITDLVMVYDEKSILLFERPKPKTNIKKI